MTEFQATEQARREGLLLQLAELLNPDRKGGAMSLESRRGGPGGAGFHPLRLAPAIRARGARRPHPKAGR